MQNIKMMKQLAVMVNCESRIHCSTMCIFCFKTM